MLTSNLKLQLQSQLQLPRLIRRLDRPKRHRRDVRIGRPEVRPVENIERLGPELQPKSLLQRKPLRHTQVHLIKRKPFEDIPPRIPKRLKELRNRYFRPVHVLRHWSKWINDKIFQPLGMQRTRTSLPFLDNNPLIAGGYTSTATDYSRFVQMILNAGVFEGRRILLPDSIEQMPSDQTAAARIVSSPYLSVPGFTQTRYGVGGWLTPNPQQPSIEMSSQGAFGFSPWVDYTRNLTGVLAANDQLSRGMPVYLQLRTALSRLILTASLTYSGTTNAASFRTGPLSPGEIVVLFGDNLGPDSLTSAPLTGNRFPNEWQGTQVPIDNQPIPIIYTSRRQVAAVIPFSVATKTGVTLEVSCQGRRTGAFTMPVSETSPGIFNNAILNQDGTLNSPNNPALSGSILMLYGTGFGRLETQATDGAILPAAVGHTATIRATINETQAQILEAGSAPGLVAGATQINLQLPRDLAAGRYQLRIDAADTPLKGTIEISVL